MIINDESIINFLNQYNYDLRKSKNGRWIDQKCTPDVINIIADCVVDFVKEDSSVKFSSKDIWMSEHSGEIIELFLNKPHPNNAHASNEYDKFFAQPLEFLYSSKVLNKEKKGNKNIYSINNMDLLEYISIKDKNAFNFSEYYIEKVLKDSGLWDIFSNFLYEQNQTSYDSLKNNFYFFYRKNTKIKTQVESNRIFTKVINPIAFKHQKLGTKSGRISSDIINYSDLIYNQKNFRDLYNNKPKGITRKEWRLQQSELPSEEVYLYKSNKAVNFLHKFNKEYRNDCTEVCVNKNKCTSVQMHHIFPKNNFPEISYFYENIIALTPNQHLSYAHPKNYTNQIDVKCQRIFLKEKAVRINENISNKEVETIYSFDNFVEVLNEGFNKDYSIENNDYNSVIKILNKCY